ncbi:hypothetical protein [Shewanella youngdeokensis]|uniref:DUF2750 domain-containing protein n=1 Tax=Shewanella youngdeokensis TaxID=2999068 RepID=A0ABZ0JUH5_9GAMM|nr:hypothetical protein RGE70_11525 [Shewanella sp. DAU334]
MEFPSDLCDYLKEGNQLDYDVSKAEAGKVGICNLAEIKSGVVWVSPEDDEIDAFYEITAVSITNYCEDYDPEFILLWLPNEKVYGAWDCDHWVLTIFPNASWTDIAENPLPFLNAQWYPESDLGQVFNPASKYELILGRPF